MRSLFLWCFLFILVVSADQECNGRIPEKLEDPAKPYCVEVIKYKVHNDKQALATCLEHFPTTFVEGTIDPPEGDYIKCKVYRQFECRMFPGSISMFDKCYKFFPALGEVTMKEYQSNRAKYCEDIEGVPGGIPIFFTMTQAKHIAMEAHRQGIAKIWVNVNHKGKTIEKSGDMPKETMIFKEPFKLHEAHYWKGEKLLATPMVKDKHVVLASEKADYLFFRSKTDHWNNLIQGSFERAAEDSTAGIVCEYQARISPSQGKFYCEKMGKKGLGLNAVFAEWFDKHRCLYTTLTHYSLMGTENAIKSFTGCREKPSKEYTSGLDDGTAYSGYYDGITRNEHRGTYRVAGIRVSREITNSYAQKYPTRIRKHCDKTDIKYSEDDLKWQRSVYEIYDHSFNKKFSDELLLRYRDFNKPHYDDGWMRDYPKDECSDFPSAEMYSNTLAVKDGSIIDVPTPVLLPAICSIATNVDCDIQKYRNNKNVCENEEICKDSVEYDEQTKLYAKCGCPGSYWKRNGVTCDYANVYDTLDICGTGWYTGNSSPYDIKAGKAYKKDYYPNTNRFLRILNVRKGCTVTLYADESNTVVAMGPLELGAHEIPTNARHTLREWNGDKESVSLTCSCSDM